MFENSVRESDEKNCVNPNRGTKPCVCVFSLRLKKDANRRSESRSELRVRVLALHNRSDNVCGTAEHPGAADALRSPHQHHTASSQQHFRSEKRHLRRSMYHSVPVSPFVLVGRLRFSHRSLPDSLSSARREAKPEHVLIFKPISVHRSSA